MLPRHLLAMPVALLVSGLAVAPASADPYVGTITTSCTVDLDASAADRRLSAVVDVNGSGTAPVRGVLVAVFSGPDGVMRRERVDYDGGRVVLGGPKATRKGRYLAEVSFAPRAGTVFTACEDDDGLDVGISDDGTGTDDPDGTDGTGDNGDNGSSPQGGQAIDDGVLPDTGGAPLWVLPVGAGLLALGAGLVLRGRRTRAVAQTS